MNEPTRSVASPLLRSLHRVDDALFSVERLVVVVSMTAMVMMVFFDVVDRRLESPEGKLAALLLWIGARAGFHVGVAGAPWVPTMW